MTSETFTNITLKALLQQLAWIAEEHYIDNLIIYFDTSKQMWTAVVYFETQP